MGLDLVEYAMRIEEEFEIEIPDEVAEKLITPKDVIDYVLSRIGNQKSREEIAEKIWELLVDETGVDRTKYDENSRFIQDMGLD